MSDDANRLQQHSERDLVDALNLRRYHRAIAETIGQEIRRRYQPPRDLPNRILTPLAQLEGATGVEQIFLVEQIILNQQALERSRELIRHIDGLLAKNSRMTK
jgi:hypothetical protein